MGKFRSKDGCLTCRARRVKCDEVHPDCGPCGKKNRPCVWEPQHAKFHEYDPGSTGSAGTATSARNDQAEKAGREQDDEGDFFQEEEGKGKGVQDGIRGHRNDSRAMERVNTLFEHTPEYDTPGQSSHRSKTSAPLHGAVGSSSEGSPGGIPIAWLLHRPTTHHSPASAGSPSRPLHHRQPSDSPLPLNRHEASLVHHYAEHLGRWLDCSDAARQFTLRAPVQIRFCPPLLHAVLAFAAKHRKDTFSSMRAYQRCIEAVICRLNDGSATYDDNLLCTIVILRFYEQLNVSSITGTDSEQHLAGCSAILRVSQVRTVDPSAPTLRESAFWVYVRQSLYNATINQVPPDLDFSLELNPSPDQMSDSHPLAQLRLETAWTNQILWLCAGIVNFCFDGTSNQERVPVWNNLVGSVQRWRTQRPASFDPIWSGEADSGNVFPEVLFTADWHVLAFGYYHFCCILLLRYKPGPKFAMRNIGSNLTDEDLQILEHARAICGSCRSSPETVPNIVTLCHTVFIWGPLLNVREEQEAILSLLRYAEDSHAWLTTWIVNALKGQWGLA